MLSSHHYKKLHSLPREFGSGEIGVFFWQKHILGFFQLDLTSISKSKICLPYPARVQLKENNMFLNGKHILKKPVSRLTFNVNNAL